MNSKELRDRIIQLNGYDGSPNDQIAHGLANYIFTILSQSGDHPRHILDIYGSKLECEDLDELVAAAASLREELKSELSPADWKEYFSGRAG